MNIFKWDSGFFLDVKQITSLSGMMEEREEGLTEPVSETGPRCIELYQAS